MKDKSVLLLGGTGTLSSAVLNQALSNDYKITIMNRGQRKKTLPKEIEQIKCDFTNRVELERIFADKRYNVVVDFLSRKEEDIERIYPLFAKRCRQYIFISSACVYRRASHDFPLTETSAKPNLDWLYNIQKYECEIVLRELSKKEESVYTIIRPYITYDDERIPMGLTPAYQFHRTIIERMRAGKPWLLWNDGKAITTITHAEDFARAVVGLFENKKAYNEDFHVTSRFHCTHKELAELVFRKLNITPNIVSFNTEDIINVLPEYKGMLLGDRSLDAIFDNSKLLSAIPSFTFNISIEQGIERVLNYWEKSTNYNYDYSFDARLDRLICKKKRVQYIHYKNAPLKSKFTYYCYRYLPLRIARRLIKKI